MRSVRATLERILCENIIPFWYPGVIDSTNGGYRLNHDASGRWKGPADRQLLAQTRMTWFFARLARSPYGSSQHVAAAHHGFQFLSRGMWDHEFGGFFWETDPTGNSATRPNKHLCGQAYGLLAISEYAAVSNDPAARRLCDDVFRLCEEYCHDANNGGYQEYFQRDWRGPAPGNGEGYMGAPASVKLVATHLHLLEALTCYARVTADRLVSDRINELIFALAAVLANMSVSVVSESYTRDWLPIPTDRISYAHQLKLMRVLMLACAAAGKPDRILQNLYHASFQTVLKFAFDRDRGGFFDVAYGRRRIRRGVKEWWVQAEGLLCALDMYRISGDVAYWKCFSETLNWIDRCQVDWQNGEWHRDIRADGTPTGDKAGHWKAAYHNGLAMFECLRLLDERVAAASL